MNRSHPENQKEVYKFWLGFFEKITVLIFAVVIVPSVFGQFKYPLTLIIGWSGWFSFYSLQCYCSVMKSGIYRKRMMPLREKNHDQRDWVHYNDIDGGSYCHLHCLVDTPGSTEE